MLFCSYAHEKGTKREREAEIEMNDSATDVYIDLSLEACILVRAASRPM